MKKYKQLTLVQRYQIEALLQAGHSQTFIAKQLCVHRSTICRELKRGNHRRKKENRRFRRLLDDGERP